jgi:hypothetical protein
MLLTLSIIGILVFLALWGLIWRKQPVLAFGIFLGAVAVLVIAALLRPSGPEHIPLWLPPLPFAIVAAALFYFGTLAWLLGRRADRQERS